jgi:hypothetical protein
MSELVKTQKNRPYSTIDFLCKAAQTIGRKKESERKSPVRASKKGPTT